MDEQVRLVIEEREAFHDWMSTHTDDAGTCILCAAVCGANEVLCCGCIESGAGARVRYRLRRAQA